LTAHPRLRELRQTITAIVEAVPDEEARRSVYRTILPMMRYYDSYHLPDCRGLDPIFDEIMAHRETFSGNPKATRP
jgi:hypothetical protein